MYPVQVCAIGFLRFDEMRFNMVISDCTLKVKTVIQLFRKEGTMNQELDGQLTIRAVQNLPPLLWQDRTRSSLYQGQCFADNK